MNLELADQRPEPDRDAAEPHRAGPEEEIRPGTRRRSRACWKNSSRTSKPANPFASIPGTKARKRELRSLQFLTVKGIVTALNLGEKNFPDAALVEAAKAKITGPRSEVPELCAKIEVEVAQIESPAERAEFLAALGITEPAIHVLTRLLYKALGYISFFTTGEDEVRAWTIRAGATAVEAAYAIHSDIARGFIRAEVMKYGELTTAADTGHTAEVKLKETGKLHLKGKDYIVEDGDIVHIRHSG